MTKQPARSSQSLRSDALQLSGRIRATNRDSAVSDNNGRNQRCDEETKKRQRQPMPDKIQKDEAPAEFADIAYERDQVRFGKVMAEVHRDCEIGPRQWISNRIGPN